MMTGHGLQIITVSLVLMTLTNGIWVFRDDNDAETRDCDQRCAPHRAGDFHLGGVLTVSAAMCSKD